MEARPNEGRVFEPDVLICNPIISNYSEIMGAPLKFPALTESSAYLRISKSSSIFILVFIASTFPSRLCVKPEMNAFLL